MTGMPPKNVDNFIQESLFEPNLADMRDELPRPRPRSKKTQSPKFSDADSFFTTVHDIPVRVIKSKRRKRNIAAYRESGSIVISVPFRTTRAQISELIPEMVGKVIANEKRSRRSEADLEERARHLMTQDLPEISERPLSIGWRSMNERWGSCTTIDRTIRISDRLASAPRYVLDYVLVHELIHLRTPGHGEDFQNFLARYPDGPRAEAFLEGYEAGKSE
jgi:predicted metal-dependent hydrolase